MRDNRLRKTIILLEQAFGRYKAQIIILTILGFLSGILEGIGVNALIPLFSFVIGDGEGGSDRISKLIKEFFKIFHLDFNVTYLLIFIIFLFIAKAIISVFLGYIKVRITSDYEFKKRNSLFSKILRSDWPYLMKQKLGYLETVLMIDVPASASLFDQISTFIMQFTSLLMYILVAINISFSITLITFILGAIIFLIIKPLMKKIRLIAYQRTEINKELSHHINENILGMKTVKIMAIENGVAGKSYEYFKKLQNLIIKLSLLKNINSSFIQPFSLIFICLIFFFSYKSQSFNIAALAVIIYLVDKIFTYVKQIQGGIHNINDLFPHLKSVLDYENKSVNQKEINQKTAPFIFKNNLEFRNVSFSYDDKNKILDGVNFSIRKGEMIGIIGASGVGKTTLADLILRLFKPKEGKILLDNKDISEIDLNEWRKNIGYVSQDMFLINDTITNNIKFYGNSITDQDMIEAAKMSNIYDFIQSCPDKFETIIGERGILISAGQRQRIVIARILARKPKLLILDEATSALDNESEVKIQKVIQNLRGKITVLAIAHRLSTIIDSDRLIALEKGQIVEQGDPKELLKNKDSYFFKVYNIRD